MPRSKQTNCSVVRIPWHTVLDGTLQRTGRPYGSKFSKEVNNRPPLMNRAPCQILPHTNSYFHCLYNNLDLLPPRAPGAPQGCKAPTGTPGATGEGLQQRQ